MRKVTNNTTDTVVNLVLGSAVKTIKPREYCYITGKEYEANLDLINKLKNNGLITIGDWEYDPSNLDSLEDCFPHGTSSQRPSSPSIGYTFFDQTLGKNIVYTGVVWANVDGTAL